MYFTIIITLTLFCWGMACLDLLPRFPASASPSSVSSSAANPFFVMRLPLLPDVPPLLSLINVKTHRYKVNLNRVNTHLSNSPALSNSSWSCTYRTSCERNRVLAPQLCACICCVVLGWLSISCSVGVGRLDFFRVRNCACSITIWQLGIYPITVEKTFFFYY